MPPEDAEKTLTAAEQALLKRWVLQGGGYTEHWAFVPPTRPTPPSQDHPIDAFIENQFTGDIDFDAIRQSALAAPTRGEGFADALDVGGF